MAKNWEHLSRFGPGEFKQVKTHTDPSIGPRAFAKALGDRPPEDILSLMSDSGFSPRYGSQVLKFREDPMATVANELMPNASPEAGYEDLLARIIAANAQRETEQYASIDPFASVITSNESIEDPFKSTVTPRAQELPSYSDGIDDSSILDSDIYNSPASLSSCCSSALPPTEATTVARSRLAAQPKTSPTTPCPQVWAVFGRASLGSTSR